MEVDEHELKARAKETAAVFKRATLPHLGLKVNWLSLKLHKVGTRQGKDDPAIRREVVKACAEVQFALWQALEYMGQGDEYLKDVERVASEYEDNAKNVLERLKGGTPSA